MRQRDDLENFQQATFVWPKEWWTNVRNKAAAENKTAAKYVKEILDEHFQKQDEEARLQEESKIAEEVRNLSHKIEDLELKTNAIMALLSK